MWLLVLPSAAIGALVLSGPPAQRRRAPAPSMVSERHNQAYKETIKQFAAMNASSHLRLFEPDEIHSYTPIESPIFMHGDVCHLVHNSAAPLVTAEECAAVIQEAEEWAERRDGWTSTRHFNHPTTDIPLQELPRTRAWFNEACLDRLYPFLAACFAEALPNPRALRVADSFVVKYNAAGGQTSLAPHRDGSVISFNIALNELGEYEGAQRRTR